MIVESYVKNVLRESSTLNVLQSRLHGLDHWLRVWQNAQFLMNQGTVEGVNLELVALFALFHDSMRVNDFEDPKHGERGWFMFEYLYDGSGHMFTRDQFLQLRAAIMYHNEGRTHDDPTIGVCWDADRLDLHRKGIWPDPRFMSTSPGRLLAVRRIKPDLLALRHHKPNP